MRRLSVAASLALCASLLADVTHAWGPQGHRLVAAVAANHLMPAARRSVASLLGSESLPDVATWADEYRSSVTQTGLWHYVNIPADASAYDRDRDCPRQPGVAAGSRDDRWRDCVVDRIRYNEERLADVRLDRTDRALALKFLVHFVGDIHQPLHASAIERGGNGVLVRIFGSETCDPPGAVPAGRPTPCNLHSAWDTRLIAHRDLNDRQYVAALERIVSSQRLQSASVGTPAEWAMESLKLANGAMLPQKGDVDEAYYRTHIADIDRRLAVGGIRLAALLNRALAARPSRGG